jgi:hypothetical protein
MADIRPGMEFANWTSIQPSEIGQAVKSGLMAYGMQKSGLTDWLNNLNKKPDGSVPPITSGTAGDKMTNGVWGDNPLPVIPPSFGVPAAPSAAPTAAPTQEAPPAAPEAQNPKNMGMDWLNGKFSNFTNPQAARDIPVAQQMNPVASPANPYDWQSSSTGSGLTDKIKSIIGMMG